MEDERTKAMPDGRLVKFTHIDLVGGEAFLTAQIAGHHVVYSVIVKQAQHPFNREGVERLFNHEFPPIST